MNSRERILRHLRGEPVDRIPMIGGWILGMRNVAELAGVPVQAAVADTWAAVMQANRNLHVDAVVPPIIPASEDSIRAGSLQEDGFAKVTPEDLVRDSEKTPDTEAKLLATFDEAACEKSYREYFDGMRQKLGGLELIPTHWDSVADFSLYFTYGYVAFLSAIGLYPEAVERLWWASGVLKRERNKILVRMYRDYDLLPVLFCGHDICNGSGPMASPVFLREHYWMHARWSLEPVLEAGIRVIGHCDGNVMPLLDDMIDAGFTGFQGFQYEFGVDPYVMNRRLHDKTGQTPLFLAGLSVTRTLPFGTTAEVEREVDFCFDYSGGGRGLMLFSSNVTGVEVPPRNLVAAYRRCESHPVGPYREPAVRPWPWAVDHPDGQIPQ